MAYTSTRRGYPGFPGQSSCRSPEIPAVAGFHVVAKGLRAPHTGFHAPRTGLRAPLTPAHPSFTPSRTALTGLPLTRTGVHAVLTGFPRSLTPGRGPFTPLRLPHNPERAAQTRAHRRQTRERQPKTRLRGMSAALREPASQDDNDAPICYSISPWENERVFTSRTSLRTLSSRRLRKWSSIRTSGSMPRMTGLLVCLPGPCWVSRKAGSSSTTWCRTSNTA
jgi:hypothetical protein